MLGICDSYNNSHKSISWFKDDLKVIRFISKMIMHWCDDILITFSWFFDDNVLRFN